MRAATLGFIAVAALSACTSISTKPYEDARDAVSEISQFTQANVNMSREFARDSFADRIGLDKKKDMSDLLLTDEVRIRGDAAMLAIEDARASIKVFNNAMVEYFDLLVALSGKEVATDAEFDDLAVKLNKSTEKLGAKEAAPIISTAAAAIFKQFLNSKREKELKAAISRNQAAVERFSSLGVELVGIFRTNVRKSYSMRFTYLSEVFKLGVGDIERRRKAAAATLELNDRLLKAMEMLNGLERAYGLVPDAHKSLISSESSRNLKVVLQQLRKAGEEVSDLYKKVKE